MRTVQIYTKEVCGFSASLRELLEERNIPYEICTLCHSVENLLNVP